MLELAFAVIAVIAAIYGFQLAIKLISPLLRLLFALVLGVTLFLANILLIVVLTQWLIWFVFYPLLKNHFNWLAFSISQLFIVITLTGIVALFLVIVFGRSSSFKQYGALAAIVNTLIPILVNLSIYHIDYKHRTPSLTEPKLDFFFALFTLSVYLTFINISTYLFYGYDKFRAWIFPKHENYGDPELPPLNHWGQKLARWVERFAPWVKTSRVPEWVLHWHSICGGTLGAFLGQKYFRHKTSKSSFQLVYRITALTQIVLLVATFFLIQRI
ncbi:DUF1294 domain-containing protein [Floridanema aerugineum]|uniref:DUF1294 domain-containing protein n=1 Tax=Floridaenema aerugineum BLCC-F46 TaxID=3153654 RepID=A0ABV4WZD9_9CYAN